MTSRERLWLAVLLAAAVVRLATLSAYPINDTTEARYAEIARQMVVTGDWVTPRLDASTPFWGKPPLSFWLTAASFKLFGVGELQARLPAFVVMLGTLVVVYLLGRHMAGREAGLAAATITLSSVLGFVIAGAVMTDGLLLTTTTLAMAAFWLAVDTESRAWGYLFFIALGLGLLTKGPIALVVAGAPVFLWLLVYRKTAPGVSKLPWYSGSALMAIIALPWYLMAEMRTPGFVHYFIVGEHWLRFLDSGWQGDLYGQSHAHPRGTIWLYGVAAVLPWTLAGVWNWNSRHPVRYLRSLAGLKTYLLLWLLTPLVFFTFAGNILPTYVASALPAFALLLARTLVHRRAGHALAAIAVPALAVGLLVLMSAQRLSTSSEKNNVAYARSQNAAASLYYFRRMPLSATFYSQGAARLLETDQELAAILDTDEKAYIAVRKTQMSRVPVSASRCLDKRAETRKFVLFEKQLPAVCAT